MQSIIKQAQEIAIVFLAGGKVFCEVDSLLGALLPLTIKFATGRTS